MTRTTADDTSRSEGRTDVTVERQSPSDNSRTLTFSPDDFRTASALRRDNANQLGNQLFIPRADVGLNNVTFMQSNPNSLAAILGLDQRGPADSLSSLIGRVDATRAAGNAPGGKNEPHRHVFDAAHVKRGEGPFQTANRLLGDSFTHKEKMAFTRALQQQYREDIATRPELAGRKQNMSDLKVGHGLLTKDNYEAVMSKLQKTNPQLADRISEKLKQEPTAPSSSRRSRRESPDNYGDYGATDGDRRRERGVPRERGEGGERGERRGRGDRRERGETPEREPGPSGTPGEKAKSLIVHAHRVADKLGTVGNCGAGVRQALEKTGLNFRAPNAVQYGKRMQESRHFDKLPLHHAQPGDIIVRDWNNHIQRAKGKNHGDIVVVTGQNRDGSLRGANDHHVHRIPPDGGRYKDSYVLRFKGDGGEQPQGSRERRQPDERRNFLPERRRAPESDRSERRGGSGTEEFHAKATGYYPHNSRMQGGHFDRQGKPLHTLQEFLANPEKTPYVSVAMDKRAAKYGTQVHIPELDQKYRAQLQKAGLEHIPFRVVDTGGRFRGKGTNKIDICTASRRDSHDDTINGTLTLQFQDRHGSSDRHERRRERHEHGHEHREGERGRRTQPQERQPSPYQPTRPGSMPTLAPVQDSGVTNRVPGALFIGQGQKWLAPDAAHAFVRARDILKERYNIDLQANDKNGAGRSFADQQDIWNRHLRGQVSAAARPGHSNHERGNAVDFLNLARPNEAGRVAQVLREVGFTPGDHGRAIKNDAWHWTYHGSKRHRH